MISSFHLRPSLSKLLCIAFEWLAEVETNWSICVWTKIGETSQCLPFYSMFQRIQKIYAFVNFCLRSLEIKMINLTLHITSLPMNRSNIQSLYKRIWKANRVQWCWFSICICHGYNDILLVHMLHTYNVFHCEVWRPENSM